MQMNLQPFIYVLSTPVICVANANFKSTLALPKLPSFQPKFQVQVQRTSRASLLTRLNPSGSIDRQTA